MSSVLRRGWYSTARGITRLHRHTVDRPLRQTYGATATATVSSNNEAQQPFNALAPVFKRAVRYGERTALRDVQGDYTYLGLFLSSRQFCNHLNSVLGEARQERIAFLLPNNASYVIVQWACWMSGQIAVPLSQSSPGPVLDYYIKDSDVRAIVTTSENVPIIEPLIANTNRKLIVFDETLRALAMKADGKTANNRTTMDRHIDSSMESSLSDDFYSKSDAMFIYTSGTTGKPKAVVVTHKNLNSQVNSLVNAWKWTERDTVLHTLPLNHIHGVVNVLLCPLYVGAKCVMLPKFDTSNVWTQLLGINIQNTERVNVYMAVPTIYMRLINEYDLIFSKNAKFKEYVRTQCSSKIRLMVSGSSPLPKPIFDRWEEITGHRLLERYGMTETGMVLSNPLEGQRIPGTVGTPLPGVHVRITKVASAESPDSQILVEGTSSGSEERLKGKSPITGSLEVKGDGVFRNYWNKPDETAKEFTKDGWFKTGDTVQYENGIYSILGRSSVDIIKSGGYKVSALQVETAILGHPDIVDCAVVGVDDNTWGQKVAAVIVVREGSELVLSQLREFGKKVLPEYAVPTILRVVDKIPKNSMGKVNKPHLLEALFSSDQT